MATILNFPFIAPTTLSDAELRFIERMAVLTEDTPISRIKLVVQEALQSYCNFMENFAGQQRFQNLVIRLMERVEDIIAGLGLVAKGVMPRGDLREAMVKRFKMAGEEMEKGRKALLQGEVEDHFADEWIEEVVKSYRPMLVMLISVGLSEQPQMFSIAVIEEIYKNGRKGFYDAMKQMDQFI